MFNLQKSHVDFRILVSFDTVELHTREPCFLEIQRPKSIPSLLGLLLRNQGAKTVLETVVRSPIESIVSEEIVFKNVPSNRGRSSARTMVLWGWRDPNLTFHFWKLFYQNRMLIPR